MMMAPLLVLDISLHWLLSTLGWSAGLDAHLSDTGIKGDESKTSLTMGNQPKVEIRIKTKGWQDPDLCRMI